MNIGVFSRHPARLCWYSACFPEHSFHHFAPEAADVDGEECDFYIVDGDMLTEDRESYGDLTRYFNRNIMDALGYQEQDLCLPQSVNTHGVSYRPEWQGELKTLFSTVKVGQSGSRIHTVIHQEQHGRS